MKEFTFAMLFLLGVLFAFNHFVLAPMGSDIIPLIAELL